MERGLATASLLSTYTEERLPVIAAMLKTTTAILDKTVGTMKSDGSGSAAWDRGGALKQLGVNYRWSSIVIDERTATDAHDVQQALDPYGTAEGGYLRAGDRAPDAPGLVPVTPDTCGQSTSLFHIFGPSHHTVLLFYNGGVAQLVPILKKLKQFPANAVRTSLLHPAGAIVPPPVQGVDYNLIDYKGHAYANYGFEQDSFSIAIIRPDGVVGGIVFGLEGLQKYFGAIFLACS